MSAFFLLKRLIPIKFLLLRLYKNFKNFTNNRYKRKEQIPGGSQYVGPHII
jgi:hypothetical protein